MEDDEEGPIEVSQTYYLMISWYASFNERNATVFRATGSLFQSPQRPVLWINRNANAAPFAIKLHMILAVMGWKKEHLLLRKMQTIRPARVGLLQVLVQLNISFRPFQ